MEKVCKVLEKAEEVSPFLRGGEASGVGIRLLRLVFVTEMPRKFLR